MISHHVTSQRSSWGSYDSIWDVLIKQAFSSPPWDYMIHPSIHSLVNRICHGVLSFYVRCLISVIHVEFLPRWRQHSIQFYQYMTHTGWLKPHSVLGRSQLHPHVTSPQILLSVGQLRAQLLPHVNRQPGSLPFPDIHRRQQTSTRFLFHWRRCDNSATGVKLIQLIKAFILQWHNERHQCVVNCCIAIYFRWQLILNWKC